MLQIVRAEKVDEKIGLFVYFPCSVPELWFLNCQKNGLFCNFVLTSARNLSLSKLFIYMRLKGPVSHLIWFIGV